MPDVPVTVYYDGDCPLCRAEIGHYRRCRGAGRLAFVDVAAGSPDTELMPDLDRRAAKRRFHVRDADGVLHSGAAAFAQLWTVLPRWRWLGRLVGFRPVLPVAETAYRAFLPSRPYLARLLVHRRRMPR